MNSWNVRNAMDEESSSVDVVSVTFPTLEMMFEFLLGTGLKDVRGLLRKPEATLLVQKMQHGEVKPGEVKELLKQGRLLMERKQMSNPTQ